MFDDILEAARVASVVHDSTGISAALDSFFDDDDYSSGSRSRSSSRYGRSSSSRSYSKSVYSAEEREQTRKNIDKHINKIASIIASRAADKLKIRDEHRAISEYYNHQIKPILPEIKELSYEEMLDSGIIAKFTKCVSDLQISYRDSHDKEISDMADFLTKVSCSINNFMNNTPEYRILDENYKKAFRQSFIRFLEKLEEGVDYALTSKKVLEAL